MRCLTFSQCGSTFLGQEAFSFRANVLWEKAAIVDADFLCHEIVQQLIHPQNRRPVLLRLKDQVVHFLGVALQIEKLNVIVPEDFLQRLRRVECARRVVARELVASIKDEKERKSRLSSFTCVTGG